MKQHIVHSGVTYVPQTEVATWKPVLLAFIALPIGFCVFTEKRALYYYCLTKLIMYSIGLASCVIMIISINVIRNHITNEEENTFDMNERRRVAAIMPIYAATYTSIHALCFAIYLWLTISYRKKYRRERTTVLIGDE